MIASIIRKYKLSFEYECLRVLDALNKTKREDIDIHSYHVIETGFLLIKISINMNGFSLQPYRRSFTINFCSIQNWPD